MRLVVTFNNCTRTKQEQQRLELVFRNAMLDYIPSVEKLEMYKRKHYYEYNFAYMRGKWTVDRLLSVKERLAVTAWVSFEND